jgi:hypothetical protein
LEKVINYLDRDAYGIYESHVAPIMCLVLVKAPSNHTVQLSGLSNLVRWSL